MVTALQWGSAAFAVVAAVLWLKSAMVKPPSSFSIHVVRPNSLPYGTPLGGTYVGHGHSPELNELGDALRRQSKWSAAAAGFAAASALCEGLAIALEAAK